MDFATSDGGGVFSGFRIEQGHLVRRRVQPSRGKILEFNQELRKNPDALRAMECMGLELHIPMLDWLRLQERYPPLASASTKERTTMWRALLNTGELDAYRVRDRSRKRGA